VWPSAVDGDTHADSLAAGLLVNLTIISFQVPDKK